MLSAAVSTVGVCRSAASSAATTSRTSACARIKVAIKSGVNAVNSVHAIRCNNIRSTTSVERLLHSQQHNTLRATTVTPAVYGGAVCPSTVTSSYGVRNAYTATRGFAVSSKQSTTPMNSMMASLSLVQHQLLSSLHRPFNISDASNKRTYTGGSNVSSSTTTTTTRSLWSTPSLTMISVTDSLRRSMVDVASFLLRAAGSPPRGFGHFADDAHKKGDNTPADNKHSNETTTSNTPDDSTSSSSSKGDDATNKPNSSSDNDQNAKEKEYDEDTKAPSDRRKQPKKPPSSDPSDMNNQLAALAAMVAVIWIASKFFANDSAGIGGATEITWQQFKTRYLETGQVDHLTVMRTAGGDGSNHGWPAILVTLRGANADTRDGSPAPLNDHARPSTPSSYYFKVGSVETFERMLEQAQRDMDIDPRDYVPVHYMNEGVSSGKIMDMVINLATLALMGMIGYSVIRGSSGGGKMGGGRNIFSIGKSGAQKLNPGELTNVKFKDVAGLDEAKVEIMEFVKFLKNPEHFKKLGAKLPKGALLVGPPGTGKTLLAKATAGEASVPFFSISGSDFIEMFVGVGPSRVRDLFAQARQSSPCIIFIDEIDAVGRARGSGKYGGGNDERENTLNQLLVEMDGFQTQEGVVVLAGTNRVDILDKALLRPGRFDRTITIDKPDIRGRVAIFEVHLKKLTLSRPIKELAQKLAALTPGFAGADIANICNEAAILAARTDKKAVDLIDFEKATERVIGGLEKKHSVLTKHEKELVAYHESGHAVAGWFLEHADPLLKVTIVPRGSGALGFAQYLPKELNLYQQDQLSDMMCMTLAGRAAEQVFFGKVSTGAGDDLNKVTKLAYAQVANYGMSAKLGNVAWPNSEEGFQKPFSERTAQLIDQEVQDLVRTAYERALSLLQQKKDAVERLAAKLLAVETVNHDQLVECLGHRPFKSDAYLQFLHHTTTANTPPAADEATAASAASATGDTKDTTETAADDKKQ